MQINRRKDGVETRNRILEVSCKLFAKNGFRNTIHEEICRLANVNTGSINYHFQSKENLYVESWRMAFQQSISKHPIDGGISPDAPVEERLRGRILSLMHRISDPQNMEFEIVYKEMANPTGLLEEVIREAMEPIKKDMQSLVRELLGDKASEMDIQLCEMSIVGQCFNPVVMVKNREKYHKPAAIPPFPLDIDIETMADHVFRFSMAGMREICRGLEGGMYGQAALSSV